MDKPANKDDFMTDTTVLAKKMGMQHAKVVQAMLSLVRKLESIPPKDPFSFLVGDYKFEMIKKEYRGTEYTAFLLNKNMSVLLATRFNNVRALEFIMGYISGAELLSEKIKDMSSGGKSLEDIGRSVIMLQRINMSDRIDRERFFVDSVEKNFSDIFPKYEFVSREYCLPDGDKIDILAKEKNTGRPVIIEAKIDNSPVHKQLRSYAHHFVDPILVGVSTVEIYTKTSDIIYLTLPFTLKLNKGE